MPLPKYFRIPDFRYKSQQLTSQAMVPGKYHKKPIPPKLRAHIQTSMTPSTNANVGLRQEVE